MLSIESVSIFSRQMKMAFTEVVIGILAGQKPRRLTLTPRHGVLILETSALDLSLTLFTFNYLPTIAIFIRLGGFFSADPIIETMS
jgi:hypothetical protein